MQKLLIAEQSEALANGLERELKDEWNISVCMDGYSTLDTLKYLTPDAMIIDLSLPLKDGLSVLEECFPALPPVILALTDYASTYVAQTVADLGVGYLMLKPTSIDRIKHRFMDMVSAQLAPTPMTERHLRSLGINNTYRGYECLLAAIPMFKEDTNQLLHKELYPKVAEVCGLNDEKCVERVIRFAIKCAWEQRDIRIWSHYFPTNKDGDVDLPTSKEFIKRLSEMI